MKKLSDLFALGSTDETPQSEGVSMSDLMASIDDVSTAIRYAAVMDMAANLFTSSRLGGSINLSGCIDMAIDAIDTIETKVSARNR